MGHLLIKSGNNISSVPSVLGWWLWRIGPQILIEMSDKLFENSLEDSEKIIYYNIQGFGSIFLMLGR